MAEEVSFGEWLKRRRSALGLTQEQLARQIHCSTSALRKFESEERRPSAEVVEQLAEIFNISPEERKSFLRFARGDWQAISEGDHKDTPWRVSTVHVEKQRETITPKHNLPLQLTSFIGREGEKNEISDLIAKNRLVTLTGVGGIGKTRLSIQTASSLSSDYPNGVWLVELAPLSDPALVPQAMVNTLGLFEQAGRSHLNILTDFLQNKRALLILDNCEHLIQTCAQLAETLLQACPDLHILATSRETLSIAGETVYLVPSLTTPDPLKSPPDSLSQYEAVQLFLERARSATHDFSLNQENTHAIAQICHHLDGIPLALELAAARVKGLSIEQIAARLDDRFHLLTGGTRTALPRHQTLQALVDWSYDLLTESERVLLRRLSVFAGGWTLQAAETICASDDLESNQILDILLRLVDKSLVIAETQGMESRYHMLETIRQYARDKLWAAGEGELLRQRHLTYFVDLAERAEPNLRAFDMVLWLDRLEIELDNIRIALQYALESDIEAQLRLASALQWFWHIRSHKDEGIDWLERGLSIESAGRGDQPLTPDRVIIRGKALNIAGFLRLMFFETDKAAVLSEESLALFQSLGVAGKHGMAYALWNLAGVREQRLNSHQWKELTGESLILFQEIDDKFGIAQCLNSLAAMAWNENHKEKARALLQEELALRKEIGDKDGVAFILDDLGNQYAEKREYKQAITLFEESLALYREVGNRWMMGQALTDLGWVAYDQGNYAQSSKWYEEALMLYREAGEKYSIIAALSDLGRVTRSQGDYERAYKMLEEALNLAREISSSVRIVGALLGLGEVAWLQGNYESAMQLFEEALVTSRKDKIIREVPYALYCLGRVTHSQGNYASARLAYEEALALCKEIKDQHHAAYILEAFAILATTQQQMERATRLFGSTADFYNQTYFFRSPIEQAKHDQAIAAARAGLEEEVFAKAWAEGQAMSLEEAVAYALES